MIWILCTLLAVVMQTFRNAIQSKLSAKVDTSGVTLARFLFAAPLAATYVIILYFLIESELPQFNLRFVYFVIVASLLQIAATSLMVILFKQQNFAIGAGLAKSEALAAAVLGTMFFDSQLSVLGWCGVLLGTLAVFVLSGGGQKGLLSSKTLVFGIACGVCFALTSLSVREASQSLNLTMPLSAAWVLLCVLCLQTLMLGSYVFYKQPHVIQQLKENASLTFAASLTSCIGSIGWFSAMALQHVAYVKTLGQVEVLLTILISIWWLKIAVKPYEIIGLGLISLAAIMVMWS